MLRQRAILGNKECRGLCICIRKATEATVRQQSGGKRIVRSSCTFSMPTGFGDVLWTRDKARCAASTKVRKPWDAYPQALFTQMDGPQSPSGSRKLILRIHERQLTQCPNLQRKIRRQRKEAFRMPASMLTNCSRQLPCVMSNRAWSCCALAAVSSTGDSRLARS